MRAPVWKVSSLLVVAFILTGCSTFVNNDQPEISTFLPIQAGIPIGQTFVARYRGLSGVDVFIKGRDPAPVSLTLTLRNSAEDPTSLQSTWLELSPGSTPGYYPFRFKSQTNSSGQYYYFTLDANRDSNLKIGAGSATRYLNGAMYLSGVPQDYQMSFRLKYEPFQAVIGLLGEGFIWLLRLGAAAFLFLIPGYALLMLCWRGWVDLDGFAKAGLSAGVSLAIYPLFFLWTNLVGLHLGWLYAWAPPAIGLFIILWKVGRAEDWKFGRIVGRVKLGSAEPAWVPADHYPQIVLVILLALITFSRLWAIRNLDLPLWGDSYQHTMIAQLLVDNHGLFNSWEPYADLQTLTYHFGFHSLVAVFHWVTGLAFPQAVLWVGQIINILAVLALYPLATRIGRTAWAGAGAVLLAGLLSPMPMYYLNWGRYTQLAGQVILPVAITFLWIALDRVGNPGEVETATPQSEQPPVAGSHHASLRNSRWIYVINWILLAGLGLTHYRILIFVMVILVAFVLADVRSRHFFRTVSSIVWIGLGGGVLFLPWFLHIFSGEILAHTASQLTTPPSQMSDFEQQYNAIGNLLTYLPAWIWIILPLALVYGIWKREKGIALIGLWWGLMMLIANPQWLRLPGSGAVNNFSVLIAVYIPAALVLGPAFGWILRAIESTVRQKNTARIMNTDKFKGRQSLVLLSVILILLATAVYSARIRLSDFRPFQHALATRPDVRAATWISQNTPADSLFLVNSFLAYGGTTAVGSDGGWWLPLLAHRRTTLPPINYGTEKVPSSTYQVDLIDFTRILQTKSVSDSEFLAALRKKGVSYIYIGQLQGRVNNPGTVLEPSQFQADPNYELVYHQDRVWIFRFIQSSSTVHLIDQYGN